MRYRKKPVVIEAIRWDGTNAEAMLAIGLDVFCNAPGSALIIPTLEGNMRADIGDWIIRGVKGELYPRKPDIFEATYEVAS